ncbi:MAG TPA: ribosome assembly cofactor RimP [Bacteroidales bacterium]|jgi:ribosome maturation factor RimP|nr:ribosome assembly cofactor RimP [Bacteroidales bacterium]|tara:strand:- start:317 stop:778 length:462 start_codon:yes stop_codon:yes gene_type:complete
MINKEHISKLADECLFGSDRFVVGINIGTDNNISVFIDGDNGVTIANCVELSRYIENSLDRDNEDFELNVSSAGVDHPFILLRQYINNVDSKVKVINKDGEKITGILKNANKDEIELLEEIKSKNKKIKKISTGKVLTIPMNTIKETKRIITF